LISSSNSGTTPAGLRKQMMVKRTVLDRTKGPLLLELNARPGLGIQMANGAGLLPRLQMVERHCQDLTSLEDRVAFVYENFKC